jgi:alpha-ketoglutarate-dependent taurine dioxygenase
MIFVSQGTSIDGSALSGVKVGPVGKSHYPLCIEPATPALRTDLEAATNWIRENRPQLEAELRKVGAILFRGFPLDDAASFNEFFSAFPDHQGGYAGGTSQRNAVSGRVMESTVAPADRVIPIHQEMAYSPSYPRRIAFFCELPSRIGGETPICDMRMLTRDMPRTLHDNVLNRGLRYWRHFRNPNYATGVLELDIVHRTWQEAFQTDDRDLIERQVRTMGSDMAWCETGLLISNPSAGFVMHPETGENIWFNSIGGYNFTKRVIGERIAKLYEEYYGVNRTMPFGVTYGDGEPIDLDDVGPLYDVTEKIQVALPWQKGDVYLLDNILIGHGRNTFEGERKIRVSLLH